MILFISVLNVNTAQTLEQDNFIHDYIRETLTNFLAVHQESSFNAKNFP